MAQHRSAEEAFRWSHIAQEQADAVKAARGQPFYGSLYVSCRMAPNDPFCGGKRMNSESFVKALQYEIMREQANALGRAGSKLEIALQNYHNFITQCGRSDTVKLAALLDDIAAKMWALALQRELIGFHHGNIEWISATFDIPTSVLSRFDARRPAE